MIEFEHSTNPVERLKYKKFLGMAIDRVKKNIENMESIDPIDMPRFISREEEYLKILRKKYSQFKTHEQGLIYRCNVCGEKVCICAEAGISPKIEENELEDHGSVQNIAEEVAQKLF